MKSFSLPDVLDVLFYTVSAWFLSLGIMRYLRLPTGIAISFSTLVAGAVGIFCALLLMTFRGKKRLDKGERELREKLMLHLALEKEERVRSALLQALLADGNRANCEGEGIRCGEELFIPRFTMQPVSADTVADVLRRYGEEKFVLVCNELSPEAGKLLSSFGKRAMRADEVFSLFRRTSLPEPLICGELPRRTAKQKLRASFSKKNARPFFVSGLLLLIMSLFALFPLYYLLTGTVLLMTSVFVRAFGYAN